jgi:hypothetical protein
MVKGVATGGDWSHGPSNRTSHWHLPPQPPARSGRPVPLWFTLMLAGVLVSATGWLANAFAPVARPVTPSSAVDLNAGQP